MTKEVLQLSKVFTPTGFPVHTYVDRDDAGVQRSIENAFDTPGTVISISGPSKSGKTVLIRKIVGDGGLIHVSGGSVSNSDQLWEIILAKLDVPAETTEIATKSKDEKARAGFTFGLKGVASAEFGADEGKQVSKSISQKYFTNKIDAVVSRLENTGIVVFIDDFHYMNKSLQGRIAKQIKSAAESQVHFCIASVPHRSDDVVRSNPELRGRTVNIDTEFWEEDELKRIGQIGFPKSGLIVTDDIIAKLSEESCKSPQLMQALCLEYGRAISLKSILEKDNIISSVLKETSKRTDYSSLVRAMHQGPRLRRERNQFDFVDATSGDVYRAVLLALSHGNPDLTWSYVDLRQAISNVCISAKPTGSSFVDACKAVSRIARENSPMQRIVEWDNTNNGTLSIVDPYFLFCLRQSNLLIKLGRSTK